MLEKSLYPSNFIDQQIKQYLHVQFIDKKHKKPSNSTYVSYYKLHYIGNLSTEIKKKITEYCKCYCKSTNIKTVSLPLKVGDLFSVKESVPKYLSCPSCNVSYIGKTTCHFFL